MNAVSCTVQWPALGLPIDLAAVTFANYLLPAQKTPSDRYVVNALRY